MVVDLLDPETLGRLVGVIVLMVMGGAVGYAKGFKDGKREGLARRKAVLRHMANRGNEPIAIPSDVKILLLDKKAVK